MDERYIRNIGALSAEEQAKLRQCRVFIAGCGGLGGYITDMLLRLGVGSLSVVDADVFDRSNLNRQLLCSVDTLGRSKAQVAARHASAVNPEVEFSFFDGLMTEGNVTTLINGCDAVIDALDSISARRLLKSECDRQKIPYIYGAVTGWVAQAALSMPGDGLIDTLYPEATPDSSGSVLAFAPALCASVQAALCVSLLCGRETERGRLYCFDLEDMEFETVDLKA